MALQDDEQERRLELWGALKNLGPNNISARSLRDLGVYGVAQGSIKPGPEILRPMASPSGCSTPDGTILMICQKTG